jgi:hypothetical protein
MLKIAALLVALAVAICVARTTQQITDDHQHTEGDHSEEGRDHQGHLPGDHHGHTAEDHLER